MKDAVVGMDLGTSRSVVAFVSGGVPVPIPDAAGRLELPSVVHFAQAGEPWVGADAVPMLIDDPTHTVFAVKRLMGRPFHDATVREALRDRPYKVVRSEDGPHALVSVRGQTYTPAQVSALILRRLRSVAQERLGVPVRRAVITVPANFNDAQREATRAAALLAGLDVIRLVNEPTAAALSVHPPLPDGRWLIYDFGGGTFDVTVLERTGEVFRVLATGGDMALGGDDLDRALADLCVRRFMERTGLDIRQNGRAMAELVQTCERAKLALTDRVDMPVRINGAAQGAFGPVALSETLTRADVTACAEPLAQRSLTVVREVIAAAQLTATDLHGILMVGGTSLVPSIREAVTEEVPRPLVPGVHPAAAVAMGAAKVAAQLTGQSATSDLLLDVVPHTVGVADSDGGFLPVIARHTALPASGKVALATRRDGQSQMMVEVLQGEAARAVDNVALGSLLVGGLGLAEAGTVEVEVNVELDVDGTLRVAAVDLSSGRVHGGFSRSLTGMTEQEIEVLRDAGGA